jgi:hypothetical protein
MATNWKRTFAAASSVGAAIFVGIFAWLYVTGVLPLEIAGLLAALNVLVGVYSLRLGMRA